MLKFTILYLLALTLSVTSIKVPVNEQKDVQNSLFAGVAKVNATLPLGVPLAGYNHGPRRVPYWPIPVIREYTTWMEPNIGHRDVNWVKALVLDNGDERIAFVTMDAIGADGNVVSLAYDMAVRQGLNIPRENVVFSASHTHSGPGALSPEFLWTIAPATDLEVPSIQKMYCESIAQALIEAQENMQPAQMDIGIGYLIGVTKNRRAPNPWVKPDTIDPNLGVVRVDSLKGSPIATLWNYATHGTCYSSDNMKFSSDIAGASCDAIEESIGGVALFLNADAGDIDPTPETCSCSRDSTGDNVCTFAGASKIAQAVVNTRNTLKPSDDVTFDIVSQIVPFGPGNLNFSLARMDNCTSGGALDICGICMYLGGCDVPVLLPESWLEQNPRFTAFKFVVNGKSTVMVTLPGEPLIELGWMVRNDTLAMGFDQTFLLGYSNNHMGYFATPNEYNYGGYESVLSLFGENTALMVREGCKKVASAVASL